MSLLLGVVVVVAATIAIAVAAIALFIMVSLSRASQLIAARVGRAPVEAFVLTQRTRRLRPARFVRRRLALLTGISRGVLKHAVRGV